MKNTKKYAALLLAALLLPVMLTGCSGSGSNTGVWIAVIVMVFIAVFSATSGIVYLVLQKVLPPEKPAARTRRPRAYSSDDFDSTTTVHGMDRARPVYTANNTAPRTTPTSNGVWVCPRDKSRNTGPYCTVCGGNRPAAPRPAARPAGEGTASQRPARPQATPTVNQQTVRPYSAPDMANQQRGSQQPAAPVYRNPAPQEEVREYRGAFARPAQSEPSALDTDFDSEVDSELLEAIFREAAQGSDEE